MVVVILSGFAPSRKRVLYNRRDSRRWCGVQRLDVTFNLRGFRMSMLQLTLVNCMLLAPCVARTKTPSAPQDPAIDVKQALKALREKLPRHIQESSLSPVASDDGKGVVLPHTKVLRAALIGKAKCIIVIGEFGMGSKNPDGIIILYCKFYDGQFHVYKHDETLYYQSGEPHDKLIKLISSISTR